MINTTNLTKRFFAKVSKGPDIKQCWIWCGNVDKNGYGRIMINGKRYGAHRISWILNNGEIPNGLYVLHKCDNPHCVNPNHLFLGSQKDNMKDCYNKGRGQSRNNNLLKILGSKNGASHITEQDVLDIRRLYSKGMQQKELAKQFGIGRATVYDIVHRHTWKHI